MTRSLTLCFLTQEFPPHTNWGGVGVQFDNLARALAADGHRVVVVSRASKGAPAYERRDGRVEVWRVGVPLGRKLLTGRTLDRILHARSAAAKALALDATHRFDAFESPAASFDGEVLAQTARCEDRLVICCHGSNMQGQAGTGLLAPFHWTDWAWSVRREQAMLRRAPTIVVSSEATRKAMLAQGVEARKMHMIPLGIDTTRFRPADALRREGPLIVGFVGRLEDAKGIDFVWRVMEKVGADAGVRFLFKGTVHPLTRSETQAQLERYARFAEYHPPGTNDEMPDFFRSLDVLLLPSRFENFGLTYVEAMASGLVVFAGSGGGGPEVVTDGVTGFVIDPDGSIDATVEHFHALAADRSRYAEMRRAARRAVVERFSIERFAAERIALYQSLLKRSGG